MTIELITGTPGAGKTTYAVSMRIGVEYLRRFRIDDETCVKLGIDIGTQVERRVVVAGIRGLKIDHERLPHVLTRDASQGGEVDRWNELEGETPKHQRLPGEPARADVPALVQNWWLWCKPGDLIVVDEAQFVAPRGTMGRKPPYWIQAFEIHRHYGVDFLIITQHPQLIDTTIRALVGMHRHVRSVMGSPVCMVYEWDHASNPERYSNASKTTFVRRAKHYALFHSSVAHLKPPSSGRRMVFIVLPLLIAGSVLFATKVTHRFTATAQAATLSEAKVGREPGQVVVQQAGAATRVAEAIGVKRRVAGCYTTPLSKCRCIDQDAQPLYLPQEQCVIAAQGFDGLVRWEKRADPVQNHYGAAGGQPGSAEPAASPSSGAMGRPPGREAT